MKRQTLDEYLDGELDAGSRSAVEQELSTDASAAKLLAGLKAQRAARAAAFAAFEPSPEQTQALVSCVMDACHEAQLAPVGRIGPWVRRVSAVAAALAVVIGAFAVGRMSAPTATSFDTTVDSSQSKTVYSVVYIDASNDIREKEFVSMEERTAFIRDLESEHTLASVLLTKPGDM